jgi:hypothetical protein
MTRSVSRAGPGVLGNENNLLHTGPWPGGAPAVDVVMPPFMRVERVIGMALYSARAILHGRGGTSGKW